MKKYLPFFKGGMMSEVAYKSSLYSWLFICIIQFACTVFLWIAVYSNSANEIINGFDFKQVIVYFVFANIYGFASLGTDTLYTINEEIKDGTIALSLIKPISYRLRFLAQGYGEIFARTLIMAIPSFLIAFGIFFKLGFIVITSVPTFLAYLGLFLLCQIAGIALFDTINYICGILCFYTTAAWGLNQAKEVVINFFSGVFIPLAFFPGVFGRVVRELPFAGLTQNPVLILTQSVSIEVAFSYVVKNVVWTIIFSILAKLLFNHACKKVTVQGG